MFFKINLLNADDKIWFEGNRELPGLYLLELAAKRKPELMKRGADFINGAIPAIATVLVEKVENRLDQEAIDKAAIELALAVVTVESCLGLEDSFIQLNDYEITVYKSGAVRYDRIERSAV